MQKHISSKTYGAVSVRLSDTPKNLLDAANSLANGKADMDVSADFALLASRRTVFGLPVCDLDWNSALSFVTDLMSIPTGQTVISFLNAENAKRLQHDCEYRAALSSQLLFPEGSGMDAASLAIHGVKFPSRMSSEDFVPALLTYMDRPKRIGLIGEQPVVVEKAVKALSKHAPWHEFIAVPVAEARIADHGLDIILVGMRTPEQEKWTHSHIRKDDARLVVTVGRLFDVASGRQPKMPEIVSRLRLKWLYRFCSQVVSSLQDKGKRFFTGRG